MYVSLSGRVSALDAITSPRGYEGKHLDETEGISVVLAAGALIHVSGLGYDNVAALINSISASVFFLGGGFYERTSHTCTSASFHPRKCVLDSPDEKG